MEIKKLSDYKGEARLGRCVECGEMETDFHRLYRLQFRGTSICLCPDCFRKVRAKTSEIPTGSEVKNKGMAKEKKEKPHSLLEAYFRMRAEQEQSETNHV